MDWINIANLTINTLLWITTIILGVFVYIQTNRNTNKQIETDQKIADMQKEMHDKDLKASMLEKRMECYEFIHKVFRKFFDISDNSPYYIYHNSSFYELLDKVSFKYDYLLDFHLYEGKISGIYTQDIIKLSGETFLKLQEIYEDILLFKFNCESMKDCDINVDKDMTELKTKIINCSKEIKYSCEVLFDLMISEIKV